MKRMLFPSAAAASLMMLLASFTNTASAQPRTDISISYQTFYDELDPYGRWMDYPDHGYVWIPDAGPDFQPYRTNGHWVWTDGYEWMWVSDYDWGWAPFHYGRWMHDPYYGWIWVPGYEWSPAWVAWRDGGDYYGWAPLRPGINIGINFSLGGYNPPIDYWSFAPRRYITSPRIYDYCAPRRNNITIINQTTIINNYNYNRNVFRTGPGRRDAERYAGRIRPVRFRESNNPGRTRFRNNEVSVYRPQIQRDNNRSIAPRKFERFDRSRSANDREAITRNGNGNNLPQRRDRDANGDLGRRSNQARPGSNQNGTPEPRRDIINRNDNNSRPGNNDRRNRRIENPGTNNQTGQARPERRSRESNTIERPTRRPGVSERNNNQGSNEARPARPPERRSIERPQNNNRGNNEARQARPPERRSIERAPNNNRSNNEARQARPPERRSMERPRNNENSRRTR